MLGIVGISVKCVATTNGDGEYATFLDETVPCFRSDHAPLATLAIILGVITVGAGLMHKLFIYSYPLASPDPESKLHPTFPIAFHFIRAAVLLIVVVIDDVTSIKASLG